MGARRRQPAVIAAVAAGGALGSPARYGVARLVHVSKDTFPWATFWTNVTGSLALGFVLVLIVERFPPSRYLRAFFATGFIGAYTTFSTFVVEADTLVIAGRAAVAVAYVAASSIAGLLAMGAGMLAGRRLRMSG
ncbi:MAG: fluoride efflux transporter CrcB [Acidimicrobiales bacterium]